ncbi:hypothetical protein [Vibrio coralliilyticus]|uniref:hypothetical protein n=1 Tax=Vibrio coralliilyticus TaxID=190893 RepID=UPI0013922237|nr:hypothetical protein [Vibrio coralliilyticus]
MNAAISAAVLVCNADGDWSALCPGLSRPAFVLGEGLRMSLWPAKTGGLTKKDEIAIAINVLFINVPLMT